MRSVGRPPTKSRRLSFQYRYSMRGAPSSTDNTSGYTISTVRGTVCSRLYSASVIAIASAPSTAALAMFHKSGRLAKRHSPL